MCECGVDLIVEQRGKVEIVRSKGGIKKKRGRIYTNKSPYLR